MSTSFTSKMAFPLTHVSKDHNVWYRESIENADLFWGNLARKRLKWIKDFDVVKDCNLSEGKVKWFLGGQINVSGIA